MFPVPFKISFPWLPYLWNAKIKLGQSDREIPPPSFVQEGIHYWVWFLFTALPGHGGISGGRNSQREAAVGGDSLGPGGSHAERPPPTGAGELPCCPAGRPSQGKFPDKGIFFVLSCLNVSSPLNVWTQAGLRGYSEPGLLLRLKLTVFSAKFHLITETKISCLSNNSVMLEAPVIILVSFI